MQLFVLLCTYVLTINATTQMSEDGCMSVGASGGNGHSATHSPGGRANGILPGSVNVATEAKVPFSLSQVDVFLAVARTGSYISASLARSTSQPAVSKSLSGLEQVSIQMQTHLCSWMWPTYIACRLLPPGGGCCRVHAPECVYS